MGTQAVDSSEANTVRMGAGSAATFQTININFDAPGYTLRVRREETEVWNWRRTNSTNVTYAGETRTSNGSYLFLGNEDNDPTLGDGTRPTAPETTAGDNSMAQRQRMAVATEDPNLSYVTYSGSETVAWQGLDTEVTGSSTSIAVLASHQLSRDFEDGPGGPALVSLGTKFFRYTLWAQHDERGITDTVTLDFTPEGWDATGAVTDVLGSGLPIELSLTTGEDTDYTANTIDVTSTTGSLVSTQDVYNAVKVFQRVREDDTDYHLSHLNSEVPVVTVSNGLVDVGTNNITQTLASGGTLAPTPATFGNSPTVRIGGGSQRLTMEDSLTDLLLNSDNQFFLSTHDASTAAMDPLTPYQTRATTWASAQSILVDDTESGSDYLRGTVGARSIVIYHDASNWAVYNLGANTRNGHSHK